MISSGYRQCNNMILSFSNWLQSQKATLGYSWSQAVKDKTNIDFPQIGCIVALVTPEKSWSQAVTGNAVIIYQFGDMVFLSLVTWSHWSHQGTAGQKLLSHRFLFVLETWSHWSQQGTDVQS
jgi:hypothetical protein